MEFAFSTGLKYSGRRPFRLIALPDDRGERHWLTHQNNVTVLDLTGNGHLPAIPIDGWARFIERALASGRTPFFAAQLSKRRPNLKLEDLPAFGLQLLEDLDTAAFSDAGPDSCKTDASSKNKGANPDFYKSGRRDDPSADDFGSSLDSADSEQQIQQIQKAHAAHRQFQKTQIQQQDQSARLAFEGPSAGLQAESPEVLEKLELLDDLVYDAISGHAGALEQLQTLWPAFARKWTTRCWPTRANSICVLP